MNYLVRAAGRYPKAKKTKHSGDSYLIYEAGGRDLFDPFGSKTFDKLVDEVEGPGAAEKAKKEVEKEGKKVHSAKDFEIKIEDFGGTKGSGNSVNNGAFRVSAYDGKARVGYADAYRESRWFIFEVEVKPAYRLKGIATKLYDRVEEEIGKEVFPQVLDSNVDEPQISGDAFLFWYKRKPRLVEDILEAVTDANRKKLQALMKKKNLRIPE